MECKQKFNLQDLSQLKSQKSFISKEEEDSQASFDQNSFNEWKTRRKNEKSNKQLRSNKIENEKSVEPLELKQLPIIPVQVISQLQCHSITYSKNPYLLEELHFSVLRSTANFQSIQFQVSLGSMSTKIVLLNLSNNSPLHNEELKHEVGAHGKVYRVHLNEQFFAIKCVQFTQRSRKKKILLSIKEVFILKIASALKIGPYYHKCMGFDIVIFNDCLEFSMEYCLYPSFSINNEEACCFNLNNKDSKNNSDEHISAISLSESGLSESLHLMHSLNFVHLDIKPRNIAYSPHYSKHVFIDFGLSQWIREPVGVRKHRSFAGTIGYVSEAMWSLFINNEKGLVDLYQNDWAGLNKSWTEIQNLSSIFLGEMLTSGASPFKNDEFQSDEFSLQIQMHFINCLLKKYLFHYKFNQIKGILSQCKDKRQQHMLYQCILKYLCCLPPNQHYFVFFNTLDPFYTQSQEYLPLFRTYNCYPLPLFSPWQSNLSVFKEFHSRFDFIFQLEIDRIDQIDKIRESNREIADNDFNEREYMLLMLTKEYNIANMAKMEYIDRLIKAIRFDKNGYSFSTPEKEKIAKVYTLILDIQSRNSTPNTSNIEQDDQIEDELITTEGRTGLQKSIKHLLEFFISKPHIPYKLKKIPIVLVQYFVLEIGSLSDMKQVYTNIWQTLLNTSAENGQTIVEVLINCDTAKQWWNNKCQVTKTSNSNRISFQYWYANGFLGIINKLMTLFSQDSSILKQLKLISYYKYEIFDHRLSQGSVDQPHEQHYFLKDNHWPELAEHQYPRHLQIFALFQKLDFYLQQSQFELTLQIYMKIRQKQQETRENYDFFDYSGFKGMESARRVGDKRTAQTIYTSFVKAINDPVLANRYTLVHHYHDLISKPAPVYFPKQILSNIKAHELSQVVQGLAQLNERLKKPLKVEQIDLCSQKQYYHDQADLQKILSKINIELDQIIFEIKNESLKIDFYFAYRLLSIKLMLGCLKNQLRTSQFQKWCQQFISDLSSGQIQSTHLSILGLLPSTFLSDFNHKDIQTLCMASSAKGLPQLQDLLLASMVNAVNKQQLAIKKSANSIEIGTFSQSHSHPKSPASARLYQYAEKHGKIGIYFWLRFSKIPLIKYTFIELINLGARGIQSSKIDGAINISQDQPVHKFLYSLIDFLSQIPSPFNLTLMVFQLQQIFMNFHCCFSLPLFVSSLRSRCLKTQPYKSGYLVVYHGLIFSSPHIPLQLKMKIISSAVARLQYVTWGTRAIVIRKICQTIRLNSSNKRKNKFLEKFQRKMRVNGKVQGTVQQPLMMKSKYSRLLHSKEGHYKLFI